MKVRVRTRLAPFAVASVVASTVVVGSSTAADAGPVATCRPAPTVLPGTPVELTVDLSDTSVLRARVIAPTAVGSYTATVTGTTRLGATISTDCGYGVATGVRIDAAPNGATGQSVNSKPVWVSTDRERAFFGAPLQNIGQPWTDLQLGGLYMKNLATGELTVVSTDTLGNPAETTPSFTVDPTGRWALFATGNSGGIRELFGPSPTPCTRRACLYRKDLITGTTVRITEAFSNINGIGISADGNRIVYTTGGEVFWTEISTGTTRWLNQMSEGTVRQFTLAPGAADGNLSYRPISDDGRWVLVETTEPLTTADTDTVLDAYAIDALTGAPTLLSTGEGRNGSARQMIGNVALIETADEQSADVLAVDPATGTVEKLDIDRVGGDVPAIGSAAASADGRFVSFRSRDVERLLVRDRLSGVTRFATAADPALQPSQPVSEQAYTGGSSVAGGLWLMQADSQPADTTPPTIIATRNVEPTNGWFNGSVTYTFACTDTESAVTSCPAPVTFTADGPNQTATVTATDAAGNTGQLTVTVNLDTVPPAVTVTGVPTNGQVTNPSTIGCLTVDATSGVAAPATVTINGGVTFGSTGNATCAGAIDIAGNVAAAAVVPFTVREPMYRAVVVDSDANPATANRIHVERNVRLAAAAGIVDADPDGDGWALLGRTNGAGENGWLDGLTVDTAGRPLVLVDYFANQGGSRCYTASPRLDPVRVGQTRLFSRQQDFVTTAGCDPDRQSDAGPIAYAYWDGPLPTN